MRVISEMRVISKIVHIIIREIRFINIMSKICFNSIIGLISVILFTILGIFIFWESSLSASFQFLGVFNFYLVFWEYSILGIFFLPIFIRPIFIAPLGSEKNKIGRKRLKNNYLTSLISIRETRVVALLSLFIISHVFFC